MPSDSLIRFRGGRVLSDSKTNHESRYARTEDFIDKVLDLDLSRTARAFKVEERIWEPELRRIFELIHQHSESLRRWEDQEEGSSHDRREYRSSAPTLSVAIFGTYGSGKSSLLKTLAREVRRSRSQAWESGNLGKLTKLRNRVYTLPVLQPNMLSEDDHFLYAFLASALEEDLQQHRSRDEGLSAGSHNLSPVQQAFQRVSEFLQVIDEPVEQQEYDPLGLSLERLDRHTSSFRLREELQQLIHTLAHNLAGSPNNSVLLLPVDDADMSKEQLVKILDTYRRYLMHPRLVPVFTFSGPMAEELLQVHFAEQLSVQERKEVTRSGDFYSLGPTESLAFQYLVKLFPIRNRVKLGYAPARIQAAKFQIEDPKDRETKEVKVFDLLEASSILLFGHPHPARTPRLRTTLRSSLLRRQLQIVDSMHDARMVELLRPGGVVQEGEPPILDLKDGKLQPSDTPWATIFNWAAWSLMNVHRDALRELRFHIEDLYSWTPQGLRREVLRIVLTRTTQATRHDLLKRWQYRLEDRRAQIISLLAMTVFRPQMPGDEMSGDDPERLKDRLESSDPSTTEGATSTISLAQSLLWFFRLWIGFYLPQIMTREHSLSADSEGSDSDELTTSGWTLESGPFHAMTWALERQLVSTTGMTLLEPDSVETLLETGTDADKLFFHVWGYYGTRKGERWAAISLWRGLGLLGQVLEAFQLHLGTDQQLETPTEEPSETQSRASEKLEDHLRMLLDNHCRAAKRSGAHSASSSGFSTWNPPTTSLVRLAGELKEWLEPYQGLRIDPLLTDDAVQGREERWQRCFVRRLHGEHLLGDFWPLLGGAYLGSVASDGPAEDGGPEPSEESPNGDTEENPESHSSHGTSDPDEEERSAKFGFDRWKEVLCDYLGDVRLNRPGGSPRESGASLEEAFTDCPLFAPESSDLSAGALEGLSPKDPPPRQAELPRAVESVAEQIGRLAESHTR